MPATSRSVPRGSRCRWSRPACSRRSSAPWTTSWTRWRALARSRSARGSVAMSRRGVSSGACSRRPICRRLFTPGPCFGARPPARAMFSPASSARSWRRGWARSSPPPPRRESMRMPLSPCRTGAGSSQATSAPRSPACSMQRSELTVDLGAIRRNVKRLLAVLEGAQLWAVVKANGYGHGAVDVAAAALGAGAGALCVATVAEGIELREEIATARILVMGPTATSREIALAREARLELAVSSDEMPDGVGVHLKLDTGMGRWGLSELLEPSTGVVGLMSHLASADCDAEFTEQQIERFREATEPHRRLTRHLANSAGALRFAEARFDAARCGVAIYGLSPFGTDPSKDGLEPALLWQSQLAQVKLLAPGESTGYGRRFVAERPTWIGILPIGYADGFRRDMTGTEIRVAGEARPVAGTINYELVCGINSDPARARRVVVDS